MRSLLALALVAAATSGCGEADDDMHCAAATSGAPTKMGWTLADGGCDPPFVLTRRLEQYVYPDGAIDADQTCDVAAEQHNCRIEFSASCVFGETPDQCGSDSDVDCAWRLREDGSIESGECAFAFSLHCDGNLYGCSGRYSIEPL